MHNFIKNMAATNTEEISRLRWQIHQHPELGNEEFVTTDTLCDFFQKHNMAFQRFDGLTGGYVFIDAGQSSSLCFRADIDALPITEQTEHPYASQHTGKMHACGHDMHTAIAVGVALCLQQIKDQLPYNIMILFQPAEEQNPVGGAKPVIATEVFQKLKVVGIFGLHLWPSLPVGRIGIKPGVQMGSSDKFTLEIHGQSAHAAEPHNGVDAICVAADITNALVCKLRREIGPFTPALLSIGEIQSFGRYNIICDRVKLAGTIRTVDANAREKIIRRIGELSTGIAVSYGATVDLDVTKGYDLVVNHTQQTNDFITIVQRLIGQEQLLTNIEPSLIGEDFSFYSQLMPSTYFFLGCESQFPLHSELFLPDERTMPFAVALMTQFFYEYR